MPSIAWSKKKGKSSGQEGIGGLWDPMAPKIRTFEGGSFTTPGFTGSFADGNLTLTRSAEQQGLFDQLQSRLGDTTSALRSLREQVAPGFGDLTRARVKAIRDAGSRTVGNLREELGKRRVAGSSFAEREIASTEALFAQEEERARAEAKVQEIALTDQLIGHEFNAAFSVLTTLISQGNFEASLAAGFETAMLQLQEGVQAANDQIQQAHMAGKMEVIGDVIGGMVGSSDRRLKTNIQCIGSVAGYPWYSFDLAGKSRQGVMSDEVPSEFVFRDAAGFDVVNYGALMGIS